MTVLVLDANILIRAVLGRGSSSRFAGTPGT
jgi:hypothetical protein